MWKTLKEIIMAIAAKSYQAVPMLAPGLVACGCSSVDPCLHYLTGDVISFQVGLTEECACGRVDSQTNYIENGNFTPLLSGTNTSTASTLVDLSKDFQASGVQAGGTCGYTVKNTTLGTYTFVTVVVNASTLTLNNAIFTVVGQSYEIYPFRAPGSTFDGSKLFMVPGPGFRQCNIELVDNLYYVAKVDLLTETVTVFNEVTVGGQIQTRSFLPDAAPIGTAIFGFNPEVWSDDNFHLFIGGTNTEMDNLSLCVYSTIGIKIYDCDGNERLDDATNSHGWITYATGYMRAEEDIRAQVDIVWSETGLEDGCYRVCIYDVCNDTDACVLESFSIKVTTTGYNYNYNEDSDACELKIEWTNFEDFEIEQGDYLNYPEYPGVAGYQSYTQMLRVYGKVRFIGFVASDYTLNQESDGLREVIHFEGHETYELQLEPLPEALHRALAKGLAHDVFTVDGQQYVWADGEYSPTWAKTSDFAAVTVKLIKKYSKGENVHS